MRFPAVLRCTLALALFGVSTGAVAQGWPAKPVKFIVPFPPGGGADATARIIAQELSKGLGQQFVLENRGGGGGTIGVAAGIASAPDGYTVFLGATGALAISPTLVPTLAYDPRRDMSPVSKLAISPLLVAVPASSPIRSLQDLLAAARAKPGSLSYATAGNGTAHHLAGELLLQMAGISMTHVPYKGSGPAATDTLAGQVPVGFLDTTSSLSLVRAGKLRSLGTTGEKRTALAPDIATFAESGLPGFDASGWFVLGAPAGVPRDIVMRLNADTVRALAIPDVRERMLASGNEPVSSSPEELGAFIRDEIAKWAKVIKVAGVKAD
jgi:tripartite-type tricarboxylate transporter receptor subunit TctC